MKRWKGKLILPITGIPALLVTVASLLALIVAVAGVARNDWPPDLLPFSPDSKLQGQPGLVDGPAKRATLGALVAPPTAPAADQSAATVLEGPQGSDGVARSLETRAAAQVLQGKSAQTQTLAPAVQQPAGRAEPDRVAERKQPPKASNRGPSSEQAPSSGPSGSPPRVEPADPKPEPGEDNSGPAADNRKEDHEDDDVRDREEARDSDDDRGQKDGHSDDSGTRASIEVPQGTSTEAQTPAPNLQQLASSAGQAGEDRVAKREQRPTESNSGPPAGQAPSSGPSGSSPRTELADPKPKSVEEKSGLATDSRKDGGKDNREEQKKQDED